VQTAQAAVLTVMRLFRALERLDTGLTPQQYRILKLAGVLEVFRGLDAAMDERRRAWRGAT
jgi:hypothetical protein